MSSENVRTNVETEALVDEGMIEVTEGLVEGRALPEGESAARFNADMLEFLAATSLGADPALLRLHRYVPAEIYVSGEPEHLATKLLSLTTSFIRLSESAGYKIHSARAVEKGSLRLVLILRSEERLTQAEMQSGFEALGSTFKELADARQQGVNILDEVGKMATILERVSNSFKSGAEGALALAKAASMFVGAIAGSASLVTAVYFGTVHIKKAQAASGESSVSINVQVKSSEEAIAPLTREPETRIPLNDSDREDTQ